MQVLIIDSTAQGQLEASQRIMALPAAELDLLNLQLKLTGTNNFKEYAMDADLIILGPGVCSQISSLVVSILVQNPHASILVFSDNQHYCREFVSTAQRAGVRKTIPPDATALDILQELIAVATQNVSQGRGVLGKIVAFTSAKGGAGVTSLVAGLGELLAQSNQTSLLWDFDSDSRDLCRALNVPPQCGDLLNRWVAHNHIPSRDEFEKVLFRAHDRVAVLPVPTGIGEALDLCYHSDCQPLLARMLELARCMFDTTLIDVGGANGASLKTILSSADEIVILTGECPLSISACDFYLNKIVHTVGNLDRVRFLIAGSRYSPKAVRAEMQHILGLPENAWELPSLPNDPRVCNWPASGHTMYSLGGLETQAKLTEIASTLKISNVRQHNSHTDNVTHLASAYRSERVKSKNLLGFDGGNLVTKSGSYISSSLNLLKRA